MSDAGRRVGREHRIEVPKTARYLTLGPPDASEIWIVLHGYGQLASRFLRRFAPVDDESRLIVAPEALNRFYVVNEPGRHGPESVVGGTWMTREAREDEITDYVRYLDRLAERVLAEAEHSGVEPRLHVLGFSQGVATAARWLTRGEVRPLRVILWGDYLPPDLDVAAAARRWSGVELVLVRGSEDRAVQNERLGREEKARLAEVGHPIRMMRYAGGHDIDSETLVALARER
jgi:predicted esterase